MKSLYSFIFRVESASNVKLSESLATNSTENLLKKFILRTAGVVALFLFLGGSVCGQVTVTNPGNTTPAMSSTYATLAAAITDVNNRTAISGPVTITLTANQTSPAGGYSITNTAVTGGSNTNRFIFDGGGFTITAGVGTSTTTDAFFKVIGADFITIQNFVLSESAGNSTAITQIEWGIALLYSTTTNGAQNITIQNNSITLNRTNANSIGIYSNSTHTAVAVGTSATASGAAGSNSGLKVYGNTIANVNQGIIVVGPTAAADANTGLDIGGTSSGTGNTITNFGTTTTSSYINVSGTVNGILVRNSVGFNISYNSITSSNGGVTSGTLNGIQIQASSNAPTITFTNTISFNTFSLQTGFSTGSINGINYPSGSASATSAVNISNNNFTRLNSSVATNGGFDAILCQSTNLTTTISNNTFTNLSVNTSGAFRFFVHNFSMPASGSTTFNNNSIVTAFSKTEANGAITIFTTAGSSPNSASISYTNNNFSNITCAGSSNITGINNTDGSGTSPSKTITGNTFSNWTAITGTISCMSFTYWGGGGTNTLSNNTITNITGQGAITGINIGSTFSSTNTLTFANNTIANLSSTGTGGSVIGLACSNTSTTINISGNTIGSLSSTAATVTAISVSGAATTNNVFSNKIYALSSTSSSAAVTGILASAGTTNNIYNNIIGNLTATAVNAANPIIGLNISGGTTVNASFNSIYLDNLTSSGALFGASGIFASTTPTLTLRNNLVRITGTSNGASNLAAHRRSTSTLTSYSTSSNNNLFFAGTPSSTNLIYTENTSAFTNSQQTLAAYKTFMSTRDQASQSTDPVFSSTVGSNVGFLHLNPTSNNVGIEGAGTTVSGITTDFDGDTRDASTPDIGADEFIAVVSCALTPSPSSGTTSVVLSPTLSWAAATNATGYDVYLGTTSGSLTLVSTNQVGLSYTSSTALNPSTQYFWRIVPRNGTNYAAGCSEWTFTTQAATPTLSATSLTSFANQCINTTSTANSFNLSGVYLTTADITVGPLSGFAFSSASNGTYTSTLTISQSGGTLASTPVFVQFTPYSVASFNGNIPVSGAGVSTAISVAVVGTGVNTAATASTGASSSITATSATLAGSYVANCQTITAYGIEYSTSSGFTNGTGTQVTSSNQSAGSFTSSLTGLTNNVTYYYKAFATYGSTTVYGAQSSFTTPQVCNIALQESFSTTTTPSGWGLSNFSITSAISGVPAAFTSNYMRVNLWSSTTSANFTTCNYGPIGANANLTFNYSVTDYSTPYAASPAGWGNIQVQISTDYGTTYTTLSTITTSASTPTPVTINLSSYVGQYAKFKFLGTWVTGDYNVVIDDINAIAPCSATSQPTSLTFANVGPTQMTVNYTASSGSPTGYLLVRYPAGSAPTSPVNGTTYTAGATLGSGIVAYVGSNVSNVITGLSLNTNYDFYVYSYSAVTCTNGPVYNTTSPLTGSQSTTVCPTLSSVVSIGPGYDYSTLTDALVILNGCGISQPMVLELQSNYVSTNEAFPISLGTITGASATNTITIRPASGVSSALTITSANSTGTINHNGGSYFVFDGRPGGSGTSKFITIENTSSSGYAVIFQNESSNNTLRYLTIKGQNTSASSGTIVLSTTTGANGNDNNTIEYNDICAVNATTATPTNGIYALGSTTNSTVNNSNNNVSNNTIRDFYNNTSTSNGGMGINIGVGNTDWTIGSNNFYQTQTRTTFGAGATFSAIYIANTSGNNFSVNSNTIGGTAVNAGGSAMTINATTTALMRLMFISVGTTTASSVSNNVIKNISFTTTSASTVNGLIAVLNGSVNCSNNTLGDATTSNNIIFNTTGTSAVCNGILAGTGTSAQGLITISGNTIAGISVGGGGTCELRLIAFQSSGITASTQYTVTNNILGSSSVSNSINNSNNSIIYGIAGFASQTTSTNSISGNTIAGFQSTNTGTNASVYGILVQGSSGGRYNTSNNSISKLQSAGGTIITGVYHTAATTVDQVIASNNINELSHTGTGTASVIGVYYSGPTSGTNELKSNFVHSLSAATSGSTLTGIQIADGGNARIYNNMIRLGINAAGSDVTTNALVYGINQSGAASNHTIYFNSIYIGGSGVASGTNNTAALWSAATSGTRDVRNNIFSNFRANGAGTGKNYSIRIAGLTGLTINNNDYWTGSSFLALNNSTDVISFSAWQTATSQDLISMSVNPNFVNPTGSSAALDLHVNNSTSSALESGGANIATILIDRDGDVRPGPVGSSNGGGISSDIGADEFDGIPGYTCTTPSSAGTAATSSSTICAGNNVSLSLTSVGIAGTGNVYQWYSSADNINFSSINGATSSTYTTSSLSQTTYFNCVITCLSNSGSATSVPVTVAVNPLPTAPTATNSTQCGTGVPSGSLVSNTGATTPNLNWYTNPGATTFAPITYAGNLINYYSNDFSSNTGSGVLSGSASLTGGLVRLTPDAGSQLGALMIPASGVTADKYNVSFNFITSNNTGADGMSYAFGDDVSATSTTPQAEHGNGSKLSVAFDTYGTGTGAAGIRVIYGTATTDPGTTVGPVLLGYSSSVSWLNSNAPIVVNIDNLGKLTLTVSGVEIFSNLQLPAAYLNADKSTWKHCFKARTGGLSMAQSIDNVTIQQSAGLTTYPNSISSTSTFYVTESVGSCVSGATPITFTVNTPPEITAGSTTSTICTGQSTTLTASSSNSGYTYTWSNSAGSGSSVNVSPITTTNYTVTATDNSGGANSGCSTTANVTVTVNPVPTALTITPASAAICSGAIQTLVTSGGNVTLLSENFNSATNNWVTVNSSTSGTPANAAWTLRSNGYIYSTTTFNSNDNSQFYLTNSDAQGSSSTTLTTLTSPVFSTLGMSSANITFYHYFKISDAGRVQYSTDGINFTNITTYTTTVGAPASFTLATLSLPAGALNQATLYIRFRYEATYDWYWAIDNITITGNYAPTWSPSTALFTDAAATTAYSGTSAATVYAKPSTTTTYTATATSAAGCTSSNTVQVTVDPTSAGGTASSDQTICSGVTPNALTLTGNTGAIQWQSSVTSSTAGFINISGATSATLTLGALTTTTYYRAVVTSGVCSSANSNVVTITVNAIPTTPVIAVVDNCDGTSELSTTATGTLAWSNGASTTPVIVSTAGTYTVTQTANGCTSAAGSGVAAPKSTPATPSITVTNSCGQSTLSFTPATNATILWSNNATTSSTTTTNTETITVVQTVNGCPSSAGSGSAVPLVIPSAPTATASQNFCVTDNATVGSLAYTSVAGNTYTWYDAATAGNVVATSTQLPIGISTYYLSTTGSNGCISLTRTAVAATEAVQALASVSITGGTSCEGTAITFTATPTNGGTSPTYQWYNGGVPITGETGNTYIATGLAEGAVITVKMIPSGSCVTVCP